MRPRASCSSSAGGHRDKAFLAILTYTYSQIAAAASLEVGDSFQNERSSAVAKADCPRNCESEQEKGPIRHRGSQLRKKSWGIARFRHQGTVCMRDREKPGAMPPSHRRSPAWLDTNAIASSATPHSKRGSALAVKDGHRGRSSASAVFSPCACSRLD
jgi:hypothetical protein